MEAGYYEAPEIFREWDNIPTKFKKSKGLLKKYACIPESWSPFSANNLRELLTMCHGALEDLRVMIMINSAQLFYMCLMNSNENARLQCYAEFVEATPSIASFRFLKEFFARMGTPEMFLTVRVSSYVITMIDP